MDDKPQETQEKVEKIAADAVAVSDDLEVPETSENILLVASVESQPGSD